MNQEFPRLGELMNLITTYIADRNQINGFPVAKFRKAILSIFGEGQVEQKWVYDQEPPLIMLVKQVRDDQKIQNNSYVEALTNTYVETLRACLLRKKVSSVPVTHQPVVSKKHTSLSESDAASPISPVILEGNELSLIVHPAEKLVATTQIRTQHIKKDTPSPVPQKPSTSDTSAKNAYIALKNARQRPTLSPQDLEVMQSLLNAHRARSLPVIMWSQVATVIGIQEVMASYLAELDHLIHLVDTLRASPLPQLVVHQPALLSCKEDITEISKWISEQKPIAFRANEQMPAQRYARRTIQKIRGSVEAILVSVLPA